MKGSASTNQQEQREEVAEQFREPVQRVLLGGFPPCRGCTACFRRALRDPFSIEVLAEFLVEPAALGRPLRIWEALLVRAFSAGARGCSFAVRGVLDKSCRLVGALPAMTITSFAILEHVLLPMRCGSSRGSIPPTCGTFFLIELQVVVEGAECFFGCRGAGIPPNTNSLLAFAFDGRAVLRRRTRVKRSFSGTGPYCRRVLPKVEYHTKRRASVKCQRKFFQGLVGIGASPGKAKNVSSP